MLYVNVFKYFQDITWTIVKCRHAIEFRLRPHIVLFLLYLQLYLLKNTWSLIMTPQAGQSGFDTLKQINAQVNNHSITAVMITETEILDR